MAANTSKFQDFLDKHVKQGTAPGLQGVVFDRNGIIFSGSSGLSAIGKEGQASQKMTNETQHWIASCTKVINSLMVIRSLEQGYGKSKGISLNSLDDHEALIKILPEFKHGSESNVTKIITGFKDEKDSEGKRIPILKDCKNKVTLRQLLTHTSGLAYYFNHELMKEWYEPSDGSTPHGIVAFATGKVSDFEIPLTDEGGKYYEYGPNTDWLGQFIVRLTGKNLRDSFQELIVKPLGLQEKDIDMMTSKLAKANGGSSYNHAQPSARLPHEEGKQNETSSSNETIEPPKGSFLQIELPLYEPEDVEPPKGFAHFASANVHCNLENYAKILRACLIQDERLLTKETWQRIEKDDLTSRPEGEIYVKETNMPAHMQNLTFEVKQFWNVSSEKYCKDGKDTSTGINMLQAYVARVETNNGLSPGTFSWAGLGNTYWFVDPHLGVGGVFGTQLYPFYDPQMIKARYEWEHLIVSSIGKA